MMHVGFTVPMSVVLSFAVFLALLKSFEFQEALVNIAFHFVSGPSPWVAPGIPRQRESQLHEGWGMAGQSNMHLSLPRV